MDKERSPNMVYRKVMKEKFENIFIIVGSIFIGIPLGLIVGLVCWLKFPFQIYYQARVNLSLKRINRAKQEAERYNSEDIWEKHIKRIEEKKSYDN